MFTILPGGASSASSTARRGPWMRVEGKAGRMRDEQVAAAYDARAAEYIALIGSIEQLEDADVALIARWRDETPDSSSTPAAGRACGPRSSRRADGT